MITASFSVDSDGSLDTFTNDGVKRIAVIIHTLCKEPFYCYFSVNFLTGTNCAIASSLLYALTGK